MGTYSSSLSCQKCQKGNIITTDSAKMEAKWKCDSCKFQMDCQKVQKITNDAKSAAALLEPWAKNPSGATVEQIEKFIKEYEKLLHPNHVVLIDKKYSLAKMYGRVDGYEADTMSDAQFERKMALCREVLAVLDKIMPGRSRKRGMMLYELHLPLVMLANRNLQRGPGAKGGMQPKQIKQYLKESLKCLSESMSILSDEPEGSFEQKVVEGSKESLKQLEEWIQTVCSALK